MDLPTTTDTQALACAVTCGERAAIAEALNLLDDQRPVMRDRAAALLSALLQARPEPNGHLVGITGPPGAGKSTQCAALIALWRQRGLRVGVLAVDPSSPISGGALLGDRLRMLTSAEDDGVFVRSLSNRGQFGGVSAEVWPMSQVMLAGFDIVLIETVGVGQREVDIARLCDTTCYVAQPGSGDTIQFLKAGILEVPHILVVNKLDMGAVARRTLAELDTALAREHPDGDWQVRVLATSATESTGVAALADAIAAHHQQLFAAHQLAARRQAYQAYWIIRRLQDEFGSYGLNRLGGEQQLLAQLHAAPQDLPAQYELLRQHLLAPASGR